MSGLQNVKDKHCKVSSGFTHDLKASSRFHSHVSSLFTSVAYSIVAIVITPIIVISDIITDSLLQLL